MNQTPLFSIYSAVVFNAPSTYLRLYYQYISYMYHTSSYLYTFYAGGGADMDMPLKVVPFLHRSYEDLRGYHRLTTLFF